MNEKLYLSIADPCHEDWNKMTPVEQGRFCASCQKKVVDFTMQTDEEIISFFNNYNGSACGRFTDDQLDRPIQQIELKPASSFLKYAAGLLLPAFLFAAKAKGQTKGEVVRQTPKQVCMPGPAVDDMTVITVGMVGVSKPQKTLFVQGAVIDEVTKEPLAGVSIVIKGTNQGVVTDTNGKYSIFVSSKRALLQFSSIGYETKEVKGSAVNGSNNAVVKMKPGATGLMGDVVVVGYQSRRMGGVAGAMSVIRYERMPVWNKIKDSLLPAKVKVYPNPVAASGTINISFPNVKPGLYQLRLLNAAGQLFYSFQKQISGKGEVEQIYLGSKITTGIYVLQVLDEKKTLTQTTKISIQ